MEDKCDFGKTSKGMDTGYFNNFEYYTHKIKILSVGDAENTSEKSVEHSLLHQEIVLSHFRTKTFTLSGWKWH